MSSKITPDHRDRQAYVYVRQSTPDPLLHNHESRRRQYALTDRARTLGWPEVVIIDDDLGRSGGGVERPGFERLLLAICEARVGIVLAVEASRLARNGRDWHTLLEFCGLVGCLLADEDGHQLDDAVSNTTIQPEAEGMVLRFVVQVQLVRGLILLEPATKVRVI